jgi:hypothetical protein
LGKDGKQFNHDIHDDLYHQRAQGYFCVNFKAFEEAPDSLKEFKESVVA